MGRWFSIGLRGTLRHCLRLNDVVPPRTVYHNSDRARISILGAAAETLDARH